MLILGLSGIMWVSVKIVEAFPDEDTSLFGKIISGIAIIVCFSCFAIQLLYILALIIDAINQPHTDFAIPVRIVP